MRTAYLSFENQRLGRGTRINQNIFQFKKENCTSKEHEIKTYFNYSYSPNSMKKVPRWRPTDDIQEEKFHNVS